MVSRFPALAAAILILSHCGLVRADLVNGNPSTDATWTSVGNSLDNGSYIRGSGNFGYDIYTTSYALPAGSALVGGGWTAGDNIVAAGGKIATNDGVSAGWGSAFSGDPVNSNISTSIRIVTKFGTSSSSWTTSTTKPVPGNGAGSFSGGAGGVGAVLLGTNVGDITNANQNTLLTLAVDQWYDGSGTPTLNANVGRLIYKLDGSGLLDSWSVYLNTSLLATLLPSGTDIPMTGDRVNLTLQRSTNSTLFTDATGAIVAAVPEASQLLLFAGPALGLCGALYRKRQALKLTSAG